MTDSIDSHFFNMKVVIQETGITADTLRAWERRYGLPQPHRTPGGHRLYSRRDIEIVRWLMSKQEQGMSISKAVRLWKQLMAAGDDPLRQASSAESVQTHPVHGQSVDDLREEWITACCEFDEQRAERVLTFALALYPIETICVEVLQEGLSRIGDGWYEGTLTAHQEHFASALAMRRIETLIAASPPPARPERIMVCAPPEEEHVFPLRLVTLLLRRRGWDVIYLGANVPLDHLESSVRTTSPSLIVLAAQQLVTASHLLHMAETLQRMGLRVAFGGRIFNVQPSLATRIPGYFLGEGIDTVPLLIEQGLTVPLIHAQHETLILYREAVEHFRSQLPFIEAQIFQALGVLLPNSCLTTANKFFAQNIQAALILGDMTLLNSEISWLKGLLAQHGIAEKMLHTYLNVYLDAVHTNMQSYGELIVAWLAGYSLH